MKIPHWEYFRSIEADLDRTTRYVEFHSDNYRTYSNEFARLIMAASSEFDTIAKQICKIIDPHSQPHNISQYYPIITGRYPKFTQFEVQIPQYDFNFKPWARWKNDRSPDWWSKGYNKIKHDRDKHYHQANMFNAILSISGLLVAILYHYDAKYNGNPEVKLGQLPRLLVPRSYEDSEFSEAGIYEVYTLLK